MIVNRCSICHVLIDKHDVLCNRCLSEIENDCIDTYLVRCEKCQYPLVSNQYHCLRCEYQYNYPVFCITDYEALFSQNVLFDFKFHGNRKLVPLIADIYRKHLPKLCSEKSVLVPVPCSIQSMKERGWNHMELVASNLKEYRYCNLLSVNKTFKLEQKTLNREQRIEHSKNKFALNNSIKDKPAKHSELVLLDDIMTTGSTLNACFDALSEAGYTDIKAITWFIDW